MKFDIMFAKLFGKRLEETIPEVLYGAVMAQARNAELFTKMGLPDTVIGRFDALALHVYLFSRRMAFDNSSASSSLSQEVFDLFIADLDRALRELGVGDTSVPKRKKKMVRSFYGQIEDFDQPLLDENIKLLTEKVAERYLKENPDASPNLAQYMVDAAGKLADQKSEDILSGILLWPQLGE